MRSTLLALALALVASTASAQLAEHCDNDADDDGDALSDCGDPDCAGHPSCPPGGGVENTPRACQNGTDDDGDGRIDCDDEGCARLIFCVSRRPREDTPERCTNERDDDGDGRTDCEDEGCREVEGCALDMVREGAPGTTPIYTARVAEQRPEVGYLEAPDRRRYPQAHTQQPMTYLSGMLVPAAGLSVRDAPIGGSVSQLGLALTYGLLDDWQITVLPLALRLSPYVEYESPAISSTLRFFASEVVELGVYASLAVPVVAHDELEPLPTAHLVARSRATDVTQLDLALLLRLHLGELVRLDLALPAVTLAFLTDVTADLVFPLTVAVQITKYGYFGLESGVILPGRGDRGGAIVAGPFYDRPKVPFGFYGGATIPGSRRGPVADLRLRFAWPRFWDGERAGDEVQGAGWQITVEARVLTYLLP